MQDGFEEIATKPILQTCETQASLSWFALEVRRMAERYVADVLTRKGFECFLPETPGATAPIVQRHAAVLFPGYVFCRFDATKRLPILMTPGVIRVVSIARVPAPIDDDEISSLQEALRRQFSIRHWDSVPSGSTVKVESGPMAGMTGRLVSTKNRKRLLITITLLQRTVLAEMDDDHVSLKH